ncbi:hypothetical protein TNCV_1949221 [Trichonephila clavipes]|nr:hypothetical protein TNCV_1949221 [Trichonephila clavipes]
MRHALLSVMMNLLEQDRGLFGNYCVHQRYPKTKKISKDSSVTHPLPRLGRKENSTVLLRENSSGRAGQSERCSPVICTDLQRGQSGESARPVLNRWACSLFVTLLLCLEEKFPCEQSAASRLTETGLYAWRSIWRDKLYSAGKTGYCGPENISCRHHKNGGVFFSVMSRNVLDKDSRQVFTRRENGTRFHHPYVTKIGRFGGK